MDLTNVTSVPFQLRRIRATLAERKQYSGHRVYQYWPTVLTSDELMAAIQRLTDQEYVDRHPTSTERDARDAAYPRHDMDEVAALAIGPDLDQASMVAVERARPALFVATSATARDADHDQKDRFTGYFDIFDSDHRSEGGGRRSAPEVAPREDR